MKTRIFRVKDIDVYWERLKRSLEISLGFLQGKHEYGTSKMCSEAGIQKAAIYSVEDVARAHGVNVHKTACIFWAAGLCFPKYGSYGLEAIKLYGNNPYESLEELMINAIEWHLYQRGNVIAPELDTCLHAYYENNTDDFEVNIARYCQMLLNDARELMKEGMLAGKAVTIAMKNADNNYSEEKSILKYRHIESIPDEVKKEILSMLDEFTKYRGLEEALYQILV